MKMVTVEIMAATPDAPTLYVITYQKYTIHGMMMEITFIGDNAKHLKEMSNRVYLKFKKEILEAPRVFSPNKNYEAIPYDNQFGITFSFYDYGRKNPPTPAQMKETMREIGKYVSRFFNLEFIKTK